LPASTHESGQSSGCARCSAKLDLLVSDWLDGVDMARRHPSAWQHLRLCRRCREGFEALADMLVLEMAGGLRR
jgi:hypothetical protein